MPAVAFGWIHRDPTLAIESRSEVEQFEAAGSQRDGDTRNCREGDPPVLHRGQTAVGPAGNAAGRRRLAAARPAVQVIQKGAEESRGGDRILKMKRLR